MSIFLGNSEPSKIFVGGSEVASVWAGDTKIRPTEYTGPELCFTANTAGSTVQLTQSGSPTSVTLEINKDGGWSTYNIGDVITLSNVGDKVYFRNTSTTTTGFSTSQSNKYKFVMTGSIAGSGNIGYLLNKNSETTLTSSYCFVELFYGCTSLTSAPELPTNTTGYCYFQMFYNCSSLISTPSLPATKIENGSYSGMFRQCTSLTTITSFAATEVGQYSCQYTFSGTKISATPNLSNITKLDAYCFYGMFQNCKSLTTITGSLPVTYLAHCDSCYYTMFSGCSALVNIVPLPATQLWDGCYGFMFYNCTSLEKMPKLPAQHLYGSCYYGMFRGCSKIKLSTTQTGAYQTAFRIPTSLNGSTSGSNQMKDMFTSTGGTFTGTPTINTTYYTSNTLV